MTTNFLEALLANATAVLFDFDGPICSVFDGYPAQQIASELRALIYRARGEASSELDLISSPHELLLVAADDPGLSGQLERSLQQAELTAVRTALPTPGGAESIAACNAGGRTVAIVSNNYAQAVANYLARVGLSDRVAHVIGRDPTDPTLMKPNPHLLEQAVRVLDTRPPSCVFIGDQITDISAGRAIGMPTIGYANKPGKIDALQNAGADVVLENMLDLVKAIH